jgi:allophanate hydrolase
MAARLHRKTVDTLGALRSPLPKPVFAAAQPASGAQPDAAANSAAGYIALAVCGAHMSGLPLNHQLRDRGARLLRATRTLPQYRLFALPGGPPHRPGLLRVASGGGAIEVEVWELPPEQVGGFIAGIPAPLGIGTLALENGGPTLGFICENYGVEGAADITAFGGWRAFLDAKRPTV